MNKFVNVFGDERIKINFRDTLSWVENGQRFSNYMIYETPLGYIGLISLYSTKLYEKEFSTFDELEKHFLEKYVEGGKVHVTSSEDWVVYVP